MLPCTNLKLRRGEDSGSSSWKPKKDINGEKTRKQICFFSLHRQNALAILCFPFSAFHVRLHRPCRMEPRTWTGGVINARRESVPLLPVCSMTGAAEPASSSGNMSVQKAKLPTVSPPGSKRYRHIIDPRDFKMTPFLDVR